MAEEIPTVREPARVADRLAGPLATVARLPKRPIATRTK